MNSYAFKEAYDASKVGIAKATEYLESLQETSYVINVEDDKRFQQFDIDIIQVMGDDIANIEVKSDSYKSRNLFFETVSNLEKGTDGCFIYTMSDYIYYYFEKQKKMYILPMPTTREWFLDNIDRFNRKELATKIRGRIAYHSVGYTVPIKIVLAEVEGVKVVNI